MTETTGRPVRDGGGERGRGRRRRKPAIVRSGQPLTRRSLPDTAFVDDDTPQAEQLRSLWDVGADESQQFAAKLRLVATYWPTAPDPDHDRRDEADLLVAQALRTTTNHASRLLDDAHTAVVCLPRLLDLLAAGTVPARWFTFVLRRCAGLQQEALAELDAAIAGWDLRVAEDRFSRELSALLRWLRDEQEAERPRPQRSVDIFPPEDDGTACLQIQGPAPEILSLGRRLDSAARAVQREQRQAIAAGEEAPFDDGTITESSRPLSLGALRYEILTRSVLETGGVPVPKERFRINLTVPALTLLGVADGPGMLDGIHPVPAEMARELAGQESVWYRVLTDATTGAFLPLPATRYTATREMLEHLRLRNPTCAVPGCSRPTSWASEMDHIQEYDHHSPADGGRTCIENSHLLCWRHHQLKTAGLLGPTRLTPRARSSGHARSPAAAMDAPPGTTPPERPGTSPPEGPGASPPDTPGTSPPNDPGTTAPDDPGTTPPRGAGSGSRALGPGVTSWTIRDGARTLVEDERDIVTPWVVEAFTVLWEERRRRLEEIHRGCDETDPAADDVGDGPPPDSGSIPPF